MNIEKYMGYFHDGSIYKIEHEGKNMIILMESAEMDVVDLVDDAVFSNTGLMKTILGKLHINGIQNISENEMPFFGVYQMKYEGAGIFDFELDTNEVILKIVWKDYPPNPRVNDFSSLKIEAEKIWWENRPDLVVR